MDNLYQICVKGDVRAYRNLVLDKNQLSAKFANGLQAIHIASIHGHLDLCRSLVKDGAQINARDDQGMSPLHLACQEGHLELVRWLMSQKIFKNNRNGDGKSPLLCAAAGGHIEVVKMLLSENVFDFIVDNDGNSALHLAHLNGHTELARYLALNGMDISLKNNAGQLPLELGRNGKGSVSETSISSKPEINKSEFNFKRDLAINESFSNLNMTNTPQKSVNNDMSLTSEPIINATKPKQSIVMTDIKFQLASDAGQEYNISTPYNSSWDALTESISKAFQLQSASIINRLVLVDKYGEDISAFISNGTDFWDIFATSYDFDDGMVFEVYLTEVSAPVKSSIQQNELVAIGQTPTPSTIVKPAKNIDNLYESITSTSTASNSLQTQHKESRISETDTSSTNLKKHNNSPSPKIKVRLSNNHSHEFELEINESYTWDMIVKLISKALNIDSSNNISNNNNSNNNSYSSSNDDNKSPSWTLSLIDKYGLVVRSDICDSSSLNDVSRNLYKPNDNMVFEVIFPKHTTTTTPATTPAPATNLTSISSTTNSTSSISSGELAPIVPQYSRRRNEEPDPEPVSKSILQTETITATKNNNNNDNCDLRFCLHSNLNHTVCIQIRDGSPWDELVRLVRKSLELQERSTIDEFVLVDVEGEEISPQIMNGNTFWKIVINTYDHDDGMVFAVLVVKEQPLPVREEPIYSVLPLPPARIIKPKSASVLTEIRFRLASDNRSCTIFSMYNSSWQSLTISISNGLQLQSAAEIQRLVLVDNTGRDLSPSISTTEEFWAVFSSTYDNNDEMTFESTSISTTSTSTTVPVHGKGHRNQSQSQSHSPIVARSKGKDDVAVKFRLRSDRRCSATIRMVEGCAWEDIIKFIKNELHLNTDDTVIDSVVLVDGDGDEICSQITTSTEFWKVIANTYDDEEDMEFDVLATVPLPQQAVDRTIADLEMSEGLSDSNVWVIKVRLHTDKRRLASIRVHEDFSWNMMMKAISVGLSLDVNSKIGWLLLIDTEDNALSSRVTNMEKFRKLCAIDYDSDDGNDMIYEVFVVEQSKDDNMPADAAAVGPLSEGRGVSSLPQSPSPTFNSSMNTTSKASRSIVNNETDKFLDDEIDERHNANNNANANTNLVQFPHDMSLISDVNTCRIKFLNPISKSFDIINLSENTIWSQIIKAVRSKFPIERFTSIDGFRLINTDGEYLSDKIRDTISFWKVFTNTYDEEEDMVFDIIFSNGTTSTATATATDDQKSIMSELTTEGLDEGPLYINNQHINLKSPNNQLSLSLSSPSSTSVSLIFRLHSNPLKFSHINVSMQDTWEKLTHDINKALCSGNTYKEIHRIILSDIEGVRTAQIITTMKKLRQIIPAIENIADSLVMEVYFENEQDISPLDDAQDYKPFSYKSLRLQSNQTTENENDTIKQSSTSTSTSPNNKQKHVRIPTDQELFIDPVEKRVLTAIDKARNQLRTISKKTTNTTDNTSKTDMTNSKGKSNIKSSDDSAAIVAIKIRLASFKAKVEDIDIPLRCSWNKILHLVQDAFKIFEIYEITGFILVDKDNDELSPKLNTDSSFWKVFKRSYKPSKGMIFEAYLTEEASLKVVAASLAGPAPDIETNEILGVDMTINFRLYAQNGQCIAVNIAQNSSWKRLTNAIKKALNLLSDDDIDRLMLVDSDRDQITPAVKTSDRFWKAVKDAYDVDEGMSFEVFLAGKGKTSTSSSTAPPESPKKSATSTATSTDYESTPSTTTLAATAATVIPPKVCVNVRFCLSHDIDRKVELRIQMGCSWLKIAEAIAAALGPMQATWIQCLVLVGDKGGSRQLSKAIEDGPEFWKIFTSSFNFQDIDAVFQVYQSITAAPVGQINAGGYLTTSSGEVLGGPDIHSADLKGLQAIHLASVSNNIPMVRWLLKAGCLVDSRDVHGMTALHYACDGKRVDLALELIQAGADLLMSNLVGLTPAHFIFLRGLTRLLAFVKPCQVNLANDAGLSLLHCACDEGSMDGTEYLLYNGAYVDIRDNDGMTPLHYACVHGHMAIAEMLIEYGAYVNGRDDEGMSPFLYSCSDGHLQLADWLLSVGATLTARNDFGNNALHIACECGDMELVNWLIFHGLDNNSRDKDGWTPLHYASKAGHVEIAMLLQGTGVDIWVQAHEKLVAQFEVDMSLERELRAQEEKDENELIEARRAQDSAMKYPDPVPYTEHPLNESLREACIRGDNTTVISLLAGGATVLCRNHNGSTPLHFACAGGHMVVVETLVKTGADINAYNLSGSTPLHFAADKEHGQLVLWMVKQGALVHIRNKDGFTPLHFLCTRGLVEVVKEISVISPFDPNLCGSKGINLLHCSSEQGHTSIVTILLQLGALVNLLDEEYKSALHYACIRGYVNAAKCLVEGGACVNVKDKAGNTPLFYACAGGYIDLASKLEGFGAKKEIKNRYGNTCLHSVCLLGQLGMAQWLIENGASLWIENRNGDTPYEYAVSSKNEHLMNWISVKYPDAEFRYRKT
eukprot:gene1278-2466_t